MSDYEAGVTAKHLAGTLVPVKYNPENLNDCILEKAAAETNFSLTFLPFMIFASVLVALTNLYFIFFAKKNKHKNF